MLPKRGDIVLSAAGREYVVAYVKHRDDSPDQIKLWSPRHKMILTGAYTEADIKRGLLTVTERVYDFKDGEGD